MADLDPQVQVKLIEISKHWAEMAGANRDTADTVLPGRFDKIYKQLAKTVSEAMSGE